MRVIRVQRCCLLCYSGSRDYEVSAQFGSKIIAGHVRRECALFETSTTAIRVPQLRKDTGALDIKWLDDERRLKRPNDVRMAFGRLAKQILTDDQRWKHHTVVVFVQSPYEFPCARYQFSLPWVGRH